ncbi:MAG: T9SS type A sorting domain-containing protein, partial [Bacteroidetes bacterium]|nr:T9SS type A sorting domain-containing protein [Bacteroidota bacterium]
SFSIPAEGYVTVKIYNNLGQLIETLYSGEMTPGSHNIEWNAKDIASGMYIYSVTYKDRILSKAMMLLK